LSLHNHKTHLKTLKNWLLMLSRHMPWACLLKRSLPHVYWKANPQLKGVMNEINKSAINLLMQHNGQSGLLSQLAF